MFAAAAASTSLRQAMVSRKNAMFKAAAWWESKGGESLVLTWPAFGAFAITASAQRP